MTWARLDDKFPWHPKVIGLTDKAFRVHVAAFCYSAGNLTDGFIPSNALSFLGATRKLVEELVAADAWHPCDGGHTIHDFLDYNPSRADVEAAREQRSQAGRASADARRGQRFVERPVSRDVERVLQRLPNNNPARPVPTLDQSPIPLRGMSPSAAKRPLTDDQRAELLLEFTDLGDADDQIALALSHKASDRHKDMKLYVRNWLKRERQFRSERGNRNGRPNPTSAGARRADEAARTGKPHVLDILRANGRLTEEAISDELPGAAGA